MIFKIITIFPQMCENFFDSGIIQKAIHNKLLTVDIINLRDYAVEARVDDTPYGGGPGMVMMVEPLVNAVNANRTSNCNIVLTAPDGDTFNHQKACNAAHIKKDIIFICGRYAGIDNRFIENYVDDKWSLGDFILSGGELAAACFIDAIARTIPGVLGNPESLAKESFANNRLQYPQYTKPRKFLNFEVPDILLSGNHAKIENWRAKQALKMTNDSRPDLLNDKQSEDK